MQPWNGSMGAVRVSGRGGGRLAGMDVLCWWTAGGVGGDGGVGAEIRCYVWRDVMA